MFTKPDGLPVPRGDATTLACLWLLGVAACSLAGCASGPKVEAQPVAATLAPAALFVRPVGQKTEVIDDDGTRDTWTVTAVDAEGVHLGSEAGYQAVVITPFGAARSWSVKHETGNASISAGDPLSLYPLEVGRRARWTRTGINNGQAFTSVVNCEVAGQERVKPPIGEVDTFKVVCTSGGTPARPFATHTYWYAPSLGLVVIDKYTNTNGETRGGSLVRVEG